MFPKPSKAKIDPKITPERNDWRFLHGNSHYVLMCSLFSERRLEEDLFLPMNRSCMNMNCLRFLPSCQKNFSERVVPELQEKDINHSSSFTSAAVQEEEIDARWYHPKGESSL